MDVGHSIMSRSKISFKKLFWQVSTIVGLIILFASPLSLAPVSIPTVITTAQASEIYPMFTCPCCDTPLKKEEPCCGAMTQMVDFIDQKIKNGTTKEGVVLATAQEFGLDRLTNEEDRNTLREKLLANAPKDSPKITTTQVKKDLGVVSLKEGVVTTEFVIKNDGKSDLIINKLSSSCGCTSGSLIYKGTEGPRFYMAGHGQEEPDKNWSVAIAPQDEATIKVYYDPSVHPDLEGSVTRTVSVHSNDPVDFETKFTISLNQVK